MTDNFDFREVTDDENVDIKDEPVVEKKDDTNGKASDFTGNIRKQ